MMMMMFVLGVLTAVLSAISVQAQTPPTSFPRVYPGQPSGDFSPEWQNYFEVKDSLPNVTFPLTRSFAGNIPVNRPDHANDTLFFWGFEKENGSLTTNGSTDPWLVWLQGGPGSSSLAGLLLENGPLRIQDDLSFKANNYSWSSLVDSFWVDNPVGVGFATADRDGYVLDDDQMGADFVQFLVNLVKVFPSLATRPLIIAGESYAGRWIPYAAKAIFSTPNAPVKLVKLAIGDGVLSSFPTTQDFPIVSVIETYPQVVDYDTDVLEYFREQTHLCDFDLNLTYPQTGGILKPLVYPEPTDPLSPYNITTGSFAAHRMLRTSVTARSYKKRAIADFSRRSVGKRLTKRGAEQEAKRVTWKRDLSLRANGTLDPWYACFLLDELYDYMINYTIPWSTDETGAALDVYDLTDALVVKPETSPAGSFNPVFFTDNRTVAALHAPTSKEWVMSAQYPFNGSYFLGDTSPDPQDFLTELASNASALGVGIILYSGNDDSLLPHRGTEATIQNTTFGGTQGFTRRPSTAWTDDSGTFAGIVHQERNWTYVLFDGASHLVPQKKPAAAYTFLREFVLGNNQTGLVEDASSSAIGGEDPALAKDFLPGLSVIFGGSISTTTTFTYPAATVSVWDAYVSNLVSEEVTATAESSAVSLVALQGKGAVVIMASLAIFLLSI